MDIRDWMVVIGAGLILAVLVDAVRRVYRERRNELRLNAKITPSGDDVEKNFDIGVLSELPNGGARVINRDEHKHKIPDETVALEQSAADNESDTSAEISEVKLARPNTTTQEGVADATSNAHQQLANAMPSGSDVQEAIPAPTRPVGTATSDASVPVEDQQATWDSLVGGFGSRDEQSETLDWLEALDPNAGIKTEPDARLPRGIEPHVFVLNVVARAEAGFSGRDVLHILLACDLRFGDMDFFHRHEQTAGRGPIQFSVANMMSPGVFDIDTMPQLYTKGLMFFVTLPGPADMLKAFDYMYETAKTVARNLHGDVLDETRSAVTQQSLEHTRQKIRELERRILVLSERS